MLSSLKFILLRLELDPVVLKNRSQIRPLASLLSRRFVSRKSGCPLILNRHARLDCSGVVDVQEGHLWMGRGWSRKDGFPSILYLADGAQLIARHSFDSYSGSKVYVNRNAVLELGSGYINHFASISCFCRITIGEGVCISENVVIRDSDDHQLSDSSHPMTAPVQIGNHVWIGMNVTILKGVTIGDGVVIAAGSVVTHDIPARCLAAGVPAVVKKENVEWK